MNVIDRDRPETWPLQFYDRGRLRAWPDDFLVQVSTRLEAVSETTVEVAFARLMVRSELERRDATRDLDLGSAA